MAENDGQAPDLSSGWVDTVSFDGVTAQVVRKGSETYFTLDPPDAAPTLVTPRDTPNEKLLDFVRANLSELRRMRKEMIKRHTKGKAHLRYRTGDVAYVLGRPFMLRVSSLAEGGQFRHAARGRAQTSVGVNAAVSLIELRVFKAGDYDQRKGTFMSWASTVLLRNAERLCRDAAAAVGLEDSVPASFRVRAMRDSLVRIDRTQDIVWLSEDLVGLDAMCTVYAFMRQLADGDAELIAKGCPSWEKAKELIEAARD